MGGGEQPMNFNVKKMRKETGRGRATNNSGGTGMRGLYVIIVIIVIIIVIVIGLSGNKF